MLRALFISPEHTEKIMGLHGFVNPLQIPERWFESRTFMLWANEEDEQPAVWTLPYAVFMDRYTTVAQEDDYMIVERI